MSSPICPISGESFLEERFNHWTHRIAFLFSLVGFPILIVYASLHGDLWKIAGYAVFGMTLIALYLASTYYHGCDKLHVKRKLRVVDHACIYLLIAGTYTPLTLGPLRETIGWPLFATQWSIAAAGIILKIITVERLKVLSVLSYLLLGWMIVFCGEHLLNVLSPSCLVLIAIGGLSYTIGVIFFIWESLPFNHAVWHLFTMAGSLCHFFAMLMM